MERKKGLYGIAGLLENENVRRVNSGGEWWYSVIDVVALLAETEGPEEYWSDLKGGEPQLGKLVEFLEYRLPDGEVVLVEMVTVEGVLRVAQSVRGGRAERVKGWLAESGRQRLEEAENPELAMLRVRNEYERKGYDRRWVDKRLRGMAARQELTSEWARRGATESEQYRALTNQLMESAFGMDVESYRQAKHLAGTNRNLRDHMSDLELVLTMLGETAAVALHRRHSSQGIEELMGDVRQAGEVAAVTRGAIEERAGRRHGEHPGRYEERGEGKTRVA